MPRKRIYRKRAPKRAKKSYAKRHPMTTNVSRSLTPFSPRFVTKLKYTENITVSTPAGTNLVTDYIYNINALYDPNQTGTGHQPLGFDQMAAIYYNYRVFSVSYRIDWNNGSSAQLLYQVFPDNTNTTLTNSLSDAIAEKPRCISVLSSVDKPTTIKGHLSLPRLNGVTSAVYKADNQYQALVTTVPSQANTIHIMSSCNNSGSSIAAPFRITLMFHCEFFDPKILSQS